MSRRLGALGSVLLVLVGSVGCGRDTQGGSTTATSTTSSAAPTPDVLSEVPADARVSTGGGQPRTPDYWVMWSTCGENSQAAVAEENGGPAAGYFLVDDLLTEPGVVVGGHAVTACGEAVEILTGGSTGEIGALASQSLAAELNLSAGAESCSAAEGVTRVARVLLQAASFPSDSAGFPTAEEAELAREATSLLSAYNVGQLCTDG